MGYYKYGIGGVGGEPESRREQSDDPAANRLSEQERKELQQAIGEPSR